ncbi:MAG: hypothetical protein AB1489_11725 [Acidobacteriota bacterium]
MQNRNYIKKIFSLILTLGLLTLSSGLFPTYASNDKDLYRDFAAYYHDDHDEDYDNCRPGYGYGRYRFSEADARRVGSIAGYSEGFRHGRSDRRSFRSFDFDHDNIYRDATFGYRSEFRHKDNYRRGFRYGYELGYRDAYYGNSYRREFSRDSGYQVNHNRDRY